jgi:RES domain
MSSTIWTRAELLASSLIIEAVAWRAVEAQHRVSTMKLVDSLEEQAALERVLEATKPPVPADCTHLHYLLFSPFRYARSNPYASRFRRAGAPEGVFYASASPETAIAEIVFYRFLFYAESPGTPLPGNAAEYTVFAVQLRADPGLDLTRPPMSAHLGAWTNTADYAPCHSLADAARAEAIQAICYPSVRDVQRRLNYAVLTPAAFAQPAPLAYQSWHVLLRSEGALAKCEAPATGLTFRKRDFDIESRIEAGRRRMRN